MNRFFGKAIECIAYFYLALPVIIFCLGWLKWHFAVLVILSTVIALFLAVRANSCDLAPNGMFKGKYEKLLAVFLIIFFWVLLSGIGKFTWQNVDHVSRNAIFRGLVEYDWPVVSKDGERSLVYYIGFWLPSAVIGKMFGLMAGYCFQFIWAVLGVIIVYYLICVKRQRFEIWPLLVFVFFSGLDYLGVLLIKNDFANLAQATHLEWWAGDFQYSSFTTQLFWVFNQAIPAWVTIGLIMLQKKNVNIFFILSLCILASPFPFVGMIPIALYYAIKNIKADRVGKTIRGFFSIQNIIGVLIIGIPMVTYLFGNTASGVVGKDKDNVWKIFSVEIIRYALFLLLEVGIYLIILYRSRKKNVLYYIILAELLICPLIRVGYGVDFCMRASIPALFILFAMILDYIDENVQKKNILANTVIIACLLIGAITPFNEIRRTLVNSFERQSIHHSIGNREYTVEEILKNVNFYGEADKEGRLKRIILK